ncbi:DUF4153 domain-containing protein [Nocardia sp. CA-107356]|uniref:DUF4153 domain-containing protein n=1 Tax=Nocardia sp. CA-107356 TaxID=3239972 RepID=UPI003D948EED
MPRWRRIACPPGVLPAAGITGLAGAALIPLDRPGLGWVLAGSVAAAAIFTVDHSARRAAAARDAAASTTHSPEPAESSSLASAATTGGRIQPEGAGAAPDQADLSAGGSGAVVGGGLLGSEGVGVEADQGDATGGRAAGAAGGIEVTPVLSEPGELSSRAAEGMERDAGQSASAITGGRVRSEGVGVDRGNSVASGVRFGVLQWNWGRVWWAALALALLGVGAVRAAGWLFALCVVGAGVAGSLAVVGRRSVYGAWYDVIAVPIESIAGIPWVYSAFGRIGDGTARRSWRAGVSVAVTLALLAVFVPLLGGADATFATLLSAVTPEIHAESVMRWIFTFVALGFGSIGAMYLLAGPRAAATGESTGGTLRRLEWALPVGALTVLFAVFVIAQFVALFGGDDYVQRSANLTYAEYARSGFWQLSIVTMLTLAVIAVVLRWAARDSAADRAWLRILLSAIGVLSLIIVASALGRMWTYQQAYGFTVMRLLVEVCELWLGLVYLLMIAAAHRLDGSWVPRAAIGTAMATLFALSVLNPEGIVAERNIDRWQHGRSLDTAYLGGLSPDIVPAVGRLPEPQRSEVLHAIRLRLEQDSWQGWNLSRANAR